MIMRSPVVAMLWENWQLTRIEAAQRFALGLVAGSAALLLFGNGATIAFWILMVLHGMIIWLSIAKLNGGRFMDGYKPGFPFYLLYPRPVPTALFVGVAMAYDALTCAALYVVSAALLGFVFGQPLPLFSVALYIVAFHFSYTCVQWSTTNRVVQWVGSMAFGWPLFFLLLNRMETPLRVEFSPITNFVLVCFSVVAFGLTVAGVARQRRGEAVVSAPRETGSSGYPDWLVSPFRFACPTQSATKAQLWFEFKSSGLPVVAIGLSVAILIFLLYLISIPIAPIRSAAVGVPLLTIPVVLFLLGGNAFGIRRKQGRMYASAFEATLPFATQQLAGLKVLVRTACVLAALFAIGVSAWASSSLIEAWGVWIGEGGRDAVPDLLQARHKLKDFLAGLTVYALAALAIVACIAVAGVVAWLAAREALRARYPRAVLIADWLPVIWGVAIMLVALAGHNGLVSRALVVSVVLGLIWLAAALIVISTIYLFWSGLSGRSLTIPHAAGIVGVSLLFAAAWLTGLNAVGVQLSAMPVSKALTMVWPILLPLFASVLAPWALSRIRHV